MSIADRLESALSGVVAGSGCQLWGVEFVSGGKRPILRVYVDKPGGVTVDDCATVSRVVSVLLDVEDPIPGDYSLEVSSPGMDRRLFRLEHFQAYLGHRVRLELWASRDRRRRFQGALKSVGEEMVAIEVEDGPGAGETLVFAFADIKQARLVVDV